MNTPSDSTITLILVGTILAFVGLIIAGRVKPVQKRRTNDDLREIGKYQRRTMWALLFGLTNFIPFLGLLLFIPIVIFQILMVYRLCKAMDLPLPVVRCLLCLVPVISLINLYMVTNQASIILKERGIRIGVMGASYEDLNALKRPY